MLAGGMTGLALAFFKAAPPQGILGTAVAGTIVTGFGEWLYVRNQQQRLETLLIERNPELTRGGLDADERWWPEWLPIQTTAE
jgi:hypothetical protein